MDHVARKRIYEQIAVGLSSTYDEIRESGVDQGVSGGAGESVLKDWIGSWLPHRMSVVDGAVLSRTEGPTNQMDCLIFDSSESPIFRPLGSAVLVPIEGISVAVEINSGENTTYTKVIKDASKLTLLRRLAVDRLARASTPQSHIPLQASPSKMSADERVASIQRHHLHDLEPLSLIFVEDLKGSLEEASNRVAAHNLKVGPRFSVDGLFVLKQGFAMHVDPNRTGWVHQRTTGSEFAYLEETPGQVLLKLQSALLTHLYLAGKTYPSSFDPYVSKEGTAGEQIKRSVGVAGQEYLDQAAGNVDIRS